ncbi:isopentenyl diphosphate isomerase/L-lactate dehydrogenase-like FMN-dependent dehydrogenase [Bradyrhizobium sp. cir1]|nr:isopentenyl diphosphate isomerase/L-lactate dehydrogenase-like FMN-dependent dehydrogenase [Bradyrhizobium sp. cir1]
MSDTALSRRKDDHVDIVLDRRAAPATVAACEYIHFEHSALPELDLTQIDVRASPGAHRKCGRSP